MAGAFLLGLIALGLALAVSRWYVSTSPSTLASMVRYGGAAFLFTLGLLVATRGGVIPGLLFLGAATALWTGAAGRYRRDDSEQDGQGERPPHSVDRAMTRQKALEILGLTGSPDDDEIKEAHRRLIQKLHPDHGGTDFLASQLNEARDLLLNAKR